MKASNNYSVQFNARHVRPSGNAACVNLRESESPPRPSPNQKRLVTAQNINARVQTFHNKGKAICPKSSVLIPFWRQRRMQRTTPNAGTPTRQTIKPAVPTVLGSPIVSQNGFIPNAKHNQNIRMDAVKNGLVKIDAGRRDSRVLLNRRLMKSSPCLSCKNAHENGKLKKSTRRPSYTIPVCQRQADANPRFRLKEQDVFSSPFTTWKEKYDWRHPCLLVIKTVDAERRRVLNRAATRPRNRRRRR